MSAPPDIAAIRESADPPPAREWEPIPWSWEFSDFGKGDGSGYGVVYDARRSAVILNIPEDVGSRICAAVNAIPALCDEVEELRATLANERGEGEPPSVGWTCLGGRWFKQLPGTDPETGRPNILTIETTGVAYPHGYRKEFYASLNGYTAKASYPTKREAMRAADNALGSPK